MAGRCPFFSASIDLPQCPQFGRSIVLGEHLTSLGKKRGPIIGLRTIMQQALTPCRPCTRYLEGKIEPGGLLQCTGEEISSFGPIATGR